MHLPQNWVLGGNPTTAAYIADAGREWVLRINQDIHRLWAIDCARAAREWTFLPAPMPPIESDECVGDLTGIQREAWRANLAAWRAAVVNKANEMRKAGEKIGDDLARSLFPH